MYVCGPDERDVHGLKDLSNCVGAVGGRTVGGVGMGSRQAKADQVGAELCGLSGPATRVIHGLAVGVTKGFGPVLGARVPYLDGDGGTVARVSLEVEERQ